MYIYIYIYIYINYVLLRREAPRATVAHLAVFCLFSCTFLAKLVSAHLAVQINAVICTRLKSNYTILLRSYSSYKCLCVGVWTVCVVRQQQCARSLSCCFMPIASDM